MPGTSAGATLSSLTPSPTRRGTAFSSAASSPHTATRHRPSAARQTASTRCSTPGSSGSPRAATAGLPRSAASAYCVRSLVPMLKKSTWSANALALRAAAGTSTITPTWRPSGRPRPSASMAASSLALASRSSSRVLTIGNIRLTGVSCATRTTACSWSSSSCRWASASRMPRTPRNGLASGGCGA